MVGRLYQWLQMLPRPTRNKIDSIELLVVPDQEPNFTLSFPLLSEVIHTIQLGRQSISHVGISLDDWHTLSRAGLAHALLEQLESSGSYTPRQMEFAFMKLHNAEDA